MNLKEIHTIYFVGIGGIGMSALARYFNASGLQVAGYDRVASPITEALQNIGVIVYFEDSVDLIAEDYLNNKNTIVVYTPAIPQNNNQLKYFREHAYHMYKRAEILGEITKNTYCFAVAGTHGKTTTSTILGHILKETSVNATSFLGGISENYNSNLILGGDEISVVEADEFDRSFLQLAPNMACITSMDADHLDIYGEPDALEQSFQDFADKVSDTLFVKKGLPLQGITYGIEEDADYDAQNITIQNGTYFFDVQTPSEIIKNIELSLSGKHNVLNTVVALAMAHKYGVSLRAIAKALLTFKGVKRRFNFKIKTSELVLIDDYAHHPTEINAVSAAVRELYPTKKIAAIFQPHLFSRTQDFVNEFALSLAKFDELLLLDIYAAREMPIEGVTAEWLLDKIDMQMKKIILKKELSEAVLTLKAEVIVMIGAGDIGELVDPVRNILLGKAV